MKELIGKVLHFFKAPGFIQPFRYYDGQAGKVISVRTSPRYTILTVGGQEFFFNRESGRFDGTGAMAVEDAQPITGCKADPIQ